ncbi:MAG: SDR family oxidoreductase [Flavobacteriales bacterium]|nr:SDR family oxidoreductase [Flavobacteriales bacterium]MCX7768163.1 SDR family oxidoreductase [Flavobacteriales bacterium]MDW8409115.1 SDR family oxidoreductase [Flavobacteriales bacterium]
MINDPSLKKVALITGAGSGIGRALAIQMSRKGYRLAICARTKEAVLETKHLCAIPDEVLPLQADVTRRKDCEAFVTQAFNAFGRIDVLVNNAGISMRALFAHASLEVLEKVMNTNFWGTVYCTHYALPHILKTGGSVVGISSIAGFKGLPARTGYSASKFAMDGFLEALRIENLYTGLHVLIVHPGFTASNIRNTALAADGTPQGESPRNESSMMSAEECARHILKAIEKRKIILTLTTEGQLLRWVNFLWPKMADKLVYATLKKEKDSPLP